MKLIFRNITYGILATIIVFSSCGAADQTVQESEVEVVSDSQFIASYPFVNTVADTLFDPSKSMGAFYTKLWSLDTVRAVDADTLEVESNSSVNVIHFGDSHIQGGSLSDVIMRHLHARFGNAGRGMIVPYRLSGSNEPSDYAIQTVPNTRQEWMSSRVINARPELPIGISGISVQAPTAKHRLLLCVLPKEDGLDYGFNRVRVFHGQYAPIIEAQEDTLSTGISAPDIILDFNTDIDLVSKVDSVELRSYADGKFARGPIYGFSLENGEPGVLYHALGVNGACFLHWGKRADVVAQSMALEPDLIVLSMGSNEAAGSNFIDEVFYREIDRFVTPLREANPGVSILLTSPAEAFRKGVPNVNFERVSRVMKQYAEQKGVAFIDVYAATGGKGSAQDWAKNNLMGRDKIHYTEEGYRIQGLLIYNALYNGYIGHGTATK